MTTFVDVETTGLDPYHDKVLTIQVRRWGTTNIWKEWEETEGKVMARFLDFLSTLPSSETIVGYNIMGFDLPFIITRASMNGVFNQATYAKLYRSRKWFDLYHYLGADFRSVDYWLDRLGVRRTCPYTGKDIPSLHTSRDYGKIEQHALEDLILCARLYTELGSIRSEAVEHGH